MLVLLFATAVNALTTATPALAVSSPFTDGVISAVRANLIASASKSWELGTAMEALIELEQPALSVFSRHAIPPSPNGTLPADVVNISNNALSSRPIGTATFVVDGSAGDPASLGVADVLALELTNKSLYRSAAQSELSYLLTSTPRLNGVISHRSEYFQAWSDFVSMAPPFLAYAGAVQGNKTLLQAAHDQCAGYRDLLRDQSLDLWQHVVDGPWQDPGHWTTGNGWAAHGLLRVYAALQAASFSTASDLVHWAEEILAAVWAYQLPSGLLRNYLDDESTFEDAAGTALLAAATFRLASAFGASKGNIAAAATAAGAVAAKIDQDGWLTSVVDPYDFSNEGQHSPEAQAFVLMLHAAMKAYSTSKSPGSPVSSPSSTATAKATASTTTSPAPTSSVNAAEAGEEWASLLLAAADQLESSSNPSQAA